MNRRWRWAVGILGAAVFACAMWPSNPLPADHEVSRVVATGSYGPEGRLVTFDVPAEHWPRIKEALGRPC